MFAQLSLMEFQVDQLQLEIPPEVKSLCEQGVLPDIIKTRARRLIIKIDHKAVSPHVTL